MQLFDVTGRQGTHSRMDWHFTTVWFIRHTHTTAELTERVSDVLGGLSPLVRHRQERSTVEKLS